MEQHQSKTKSAAAVRSSAGLGIKIQKLKAKKEQLKARYRRMLQEVNAEIERLESKDYVAKLQYTMDERKDRWRLTLRLRSQGKTFKEIGDVLGCSAARATQLHNQAIRVNQRCQL